MIIKISKAKPLELKPVERSIESLLLRFVLEAWGVIQQDLKIDFEGEKGDEMILSLAELPRGGQTPLATETRYCSRHSCVPLSTLPHPGEEPCCHTGFRFIPFPSSAK